MRVARLRILSAFAVAGALAFSSACNDTTATESAKLGSVTVNVVNSSTNQPVGLVAVDLRLASDRTIWRTGRTSSGGSLTFGADEGGVIAGSYIIRLQLEGQRQFAAGETNDRPVTVTSGSTTTVTFKLEPITGPTPGT